MQPEQRTDEWFDARLGKATASRFNDVMTVIRSGESAARRNYRAQLVIERITGEKADTFTTKEMQWGIDNEPAARMEYMLTSGNKVNECGFFEHKTLAAGASPDGLIGDHGVLEIKCPNSATHIDTLRSGQIPRQYVAQVQGQMWITGRDWADFVSYDPRLPENAQLIIVRVERDDQYIAKLCDTVAEFLTTVEHETAFINSYGKEIAA